MVSVPLSSSFSFQNDSLRLEVFFKDLDLSLSTFSCESEALKSSVSERGLSVVGFTVRLWAGHLLLLLLLHQDVVSSMSLSLLAALDSLFSVPPLPLLSAGPSDPESRAASCVHSSLLALRL